MKRKKSLNRGDLKILKASITVHHVLYIIGITPYNSKISQLHIVQTGLLFCFHSLPRGL